MTAVEASSVGVKTMADGTLRLSVDIEPANAQAAFRLFGAPGTPLALARLKTKAEAAKEPEPPKGGAWSQWLAMRCGEPEFAAWLRDLDVRHTRVIDQRIAAGSLSEEESAAVLARRICEVQSRAEIDNDPEAAQRFQERIRGPWAKHYEATHG